MGQYYSYSDTKPHADAAALTHTNTRSLPFAYRFSECNTGTDIRLPSAVTE